jgi:hypothetical protein
VIFSSTNACPLKLPDSLPPLTVSADLTLDTPSGPIQIRDESAELIEVQFPDKQSFRHVLLGMRPQLSWLRYRGALQQFSDVSQLTLRVKVGKDIYFRVSPDRPNFVYVVPILIQYIRAKLNI